MNGKGQQGRQKGNHKEMESLTKSAVLFVGRVGALGHSVAALTGGVNAGAVAAAEGVRPGTWQQAFIVESASDMQTTRKRLRH